MENGKVKLVLLLCGHLHIIKIDRKTTHERRCFIWLQNQQIYMQIILQRGLPFEVKIPSARPVDISTLSEVEFNEELEKGYADMHDRRTKNAKKAFADIRKDYGL